MPPIDPNNSKETAEDNPESNSINTANLSSPGASAQPLTSLSTEDLAASITQRFIKAQNEKKAKSGTGGTGQSSLSAFGQDEMAQLLRHHMSDFRKYEDEAAQEAARAVMPVDRFHEEILAELQPGQDFFVALAKKAMYWFKHEFFKWVNAPPCDFCGAEPAEMKALEMTEPTADELRYGARRVELYECNVCTTFTRFARYNDPVKLLESRRGRCGEWANCFTLCLKALGFDARYVLDSTDHVWCEIWVDDNAEEEQGSSSARPRGRYVHMDPCENAWDSPLVYEKGWGKKLSYIFGFTSKTVTDVIKKYSRDETGTLPRRTKCSEEYLTNLITKLNKEALAGVADSEVILYRRKADKDHFTAAFLAGDVDLKEDEKVGRVSGSLEWRTARSETGGGPAADVEQGACPEPKDMELLFDIPTRPDFDSSGVMLVLNGDATFSHLHGPVPFSDTPIFAVQLTDASNDVRGSAISIPQIPLDKSWINEFAFRITNAKGGPGRGGADGFAFVLHGDEDAGPLALGGRGFEMGYGGLKACVAVEFDTYESRDHSNDPNDNHIAIMSMHNPSLAIKAHHKFALQTATNLPILSDGTIYFVRIFYDASERALSVWLSDTAEDPNTCALEGEEQCGPLGTSSEQERDLTLRGRDFVRVLHVKMDLAESLGPVENAYFGFTAATGGLNQRHEICGWKMFVGKG